MGCHTLFYKPYKISLEEAKTLLLEQYKEDVAYCSNTNNEYRIAKLKGLKRKLILLENDLLYEEEIWKDFILPIDEISCYVKNKGMFVETSYRDIFKVNDCTDNELFSYQETIDFIENHLANDKNSVYFGINLNDKEYAINRLKQFWEEYPDGMICFG